MTIAPDITAVIYVLVGISAVVLISVFLAVRKSERPQEISDEKSAELEKRLAQEKAAREALARKLAEDMRKKEESVKNEMIAYMPLFRKMDKDIAERWMNPAPTSFVVDPMVEGMMDAVESPAPAEVPTEPLPTPPSPQERRTRSALSSVSVPAAEARELRECENSRFSFSVRPLIRGIFGLEGRYVPNADFSKPAKLMDKQDFFLRLQSIFNNMVKDGNYDIPDDDLRAIKAAVWSGDFGKIEARLLEANTKLGIEGEETHKFVVTAGAMLASFCAQAIGPDPYWAFSHETAAYFEERAKSYSRSMARVAADRKAKREPSKEDLESEGLIKANIEVIHEIVSVLRRRKFEALYKDLSKLPEKTREAAVMKRQSAIVSNVSFLSSKNWKYLDFDKETKTVHLAVPYRDVFSKDFSRLVSYYREKKSLAAINVYLTK